MIEADIFKMIINIPELVGSQKNQSGQDKKVRAQVKAQVEAQVKAQVGEDSIQLHISALTTSWKPKGRWICLQARVGKRRPANNVSGSAVARDLRDYLVESRFFRSLLQNKKVVIRLGKDFALRVEKYDM